jgi:1-acyl-sn-glycerol-3-phosphate acyltransferase
MDYWIQINQCCLWIISRLFIILTFSRRKVYLQSADLTKHYGYVVAANHQSRLDPFVIFGSMSLRSYLKLTPVRFMAYREFFRVYLYRIFLQSWGAFPNKELNDLDYGLPLSTKILANKGTIVIHPEGMRVRPDQRVEPKRGVAVMAAEPDVRLILCRVLWHTGIFPRVSVIISEPRDCTNLTSQQIMDQIYSLS